MNRLVVFSLAVLLAPGGGLSAQQRDSMQQRGDTAEAERLRAQIEQRFSARVQHDLKLTQDQATKLRASQERFSARDRKSTRLNSSHVESSYAVFCLKK